MAQNENGYQRVNNRQSGQHLLGLLISHKKKKQTNKKTDEPSFWKIPFSTFVLILCWYFQIQSCMHFSTGQLLKQIQNDHMKLVSLWGKDE